MTGPCFDCPRACGADRSRAAGLCGAPAAPRVARAALHFGEEPCLSGTRGAGAVFFSGCSLRCIYCQNAVISRECRGKTIDEARLLEIFKELAAAGAHNLDLVTPTHYTSLLTRLLHDNPQPLPVVWNSSGYELVPKLRGLEGAVDVYLPDLKYFDARAAGLYSGAPDYFPVASAALLRACCVTAGWCAIWCCPAFPKTAWRCSSGAPPTCLPARATASWRSIRPPPPSRGTRHWAAG